MAKLSEKGIKKLPNWEYFEDALETTLEFKTFKDYF